MDFYDRLPDPPSTATDDEGDDTEHGWLYHHRRSVCVAVPLSWLCMVGVAAMHEAENDAVVEALVMGTAIWFMFVMLVTSLLSLVGSPPLNKEDAQRAVEHLEETISWRVPFSYLHRCFGRSTGTIGFPFGVAGAVLVCAALELGSPYVILPAAKWIGGVSVVLMLLVSTTSYPSFLLPQSYRAFYGRRTWIDRLMERRGLAPGPDATAWKNR